MSSVAPAFIIASVEAVSSSSAVAVSPSTWAMRSRPAMGRPWAGTRRSGPCSIMRRSASAHSIG